MNQNVLACLDHSSYTPGVCDYAAWASLKMSAPLEFIHVLDRHPETARRRDLSGSIGLGARESLLEELSKLDEQVSRVAQESGRLLLESAKQRALEAGVPNVTARQRHGELVESLAELENEARLFVLGKRGEAAESAPQHIGGNLERVVRALHRPILVVPKQYKAPASLMIAFDGSATTRKGVEMVASSPLFKGMICHVVTAGAASAGNTGQMEWADETLKAGGFISNTSIVDGDAETVLPNYWRENAVDVLVMGAYGHSRIRQLLVGSTTTVMIRTADIPVLLLR
jgi:nucleotide-binding universal stress UspA family protein